MTDDEILQEVKKALGIGGTYQDGALQIYIDEVKDYLITAGANSTTINSKRAIGIICRGVADLWNYGSGGTELSTYFRQRASQFALENVEVTA